MQPINPKDKKKVYINTNIAVLATVIAIVLIGSVVLFGTVFFHANQYAKSENILAN